MEIKIEKVYDTRARQYLSEVIKCYETGCYRSAIVLLNSVCLSDFFYKLQELRDIYTDTIASQIIQDIESEIEADRSSSKWERILVESIHTKMQLLDASGYTLLLHLRDYRNLTAHPILDNTSLLYQPSKELVESCIVEACNSILFKPSVFAKDIISFMSQDLDSKRKYILHDAEGFENYIEQKYLVHMSDSMATKVFRTFWKFTFYLLDQDCENNRRINFSLLDLLLHKRRVQIEQDISANCNRYQIADSKYTVAYAIYLLSFHPWIYNKLAKENVTLIKSKQSDMPFYKLISWYEHSSKTEHIVHLIEEGFYELPETGGQKEFCEKLFGDSGEKDALLKYYIAALRNAGSFVTATSITDSSFAS